MAKNKKAETKPVAVQTSELVANCDHPLTIRQIERMIFTIRGVQVIVDRDLATLYGVETKRMNEQVRRNLERFPSRFRFQLTKDELNEVVANCDLLLSIKYSPTLPYVFTEQGVSMLSSVLHSDTAVDVSIQIMDAFVAMRHFLVSNAAIFQRLENIEQHQIVTDQRIDEVFRRLDAGQQHSDVVLNERQRTILNLYLDGCEGKFTAKNYAKLSEVSPDTALRDIRDLVARGLLRPLEGMQRNVAYEIMIESNK